MIPVQETAGAIPNINYRAENWSGHKGFTNIVQGSASYITGSHSAKVGFRLHQNIAMYPINFYNNTQLSYVFTNGVPDRGDGVRRRELGAGTAPVHVRAVRAGSLDGRATVAAGRPALRAPRRLLPAAADGTEPLPAQRRRVPGAGRPAQPEGPDAAVRRVVRRVRQREDGREVLRGPVRDDVQHGRRMGELQPGRARPFRQPGPERDLDRRQQRQSSPTATS